MIKNISKICSFLLLFLLAVLALNEFQIMNYSADLKKIFYFLTLILIMFSSVTTLLTNKSGFFKFVSVVIMLALVIGGIISILKPGINISLYVCIILTVVYSLVECFITLLIIIFSKIKYRINFYYNPSFAFLFKSSWLHFASHFFHFFSSFFICEKFLVVLRAFFICVYFF